VYTRVARPRQAKIHFMLSSGLRLMGYSYILTTLLSYQVRHYQALELQRYVQPASAHTPYYDNAVAVSSVSTHQAPAVQRRASTHTGCWKGAGLRFVDVICLPSHLGRGEKHFWSGDGGQSNRRDIFATSQQDGYGVLKGQANFLCLFWRKHDGRRPARHHGFPLHKRVAVPVGEPRPEGSCIGTIVVYQCHEHVPCDLNQSPCEPIDHVCSRRLRSISTGRSGRPSRPRVKIVVQPLA
jgi:hypothetical protein